MLAEKRPKIIQSNEVLNKQASSLDKIPNPNEKHSSHFDMKSIHEASNEEGEQPVSAGFSMLVAAAKINRKDYYIQITIL